MAEIRETHIERDEHGRVTDANVRIERPRRGGGLGVGMLLGVLLIAGAIIAFAYTQGSFQEAGLEADRASAAAEHQIERAADTTQAALHGSGEPASN